ncbi:hypothetical protein LCM23_13155 [Cytobacillus kochii]|uniref:hypothetical protein n=1 Tax=Cytobacillus kochii TaxID=859143 RepID=UPI001CD7ADDD|nr:hypothetical protein [Cytobacillus kochii]MCA1027043.1 hypothetical protein [Cytobacillus kochii]
MDMVVGVRLQEEAREKVEKELGRKLTLNELEIFFKTSRICLMKGYNYAKSNG